MLLSKSQRALLEILRHFGAVREKQAIQLLDMENQRPLWESSIRQLECGGMIRREHDCVRLPDRRPDGQVIEAVDVMLLLAPKKIETLQKGTAPFVVTFFKNREDKLWRYDICPVPPGKEAVICAVLEGINSKYRLVVFVLKTPEQQKSLTIPCEHCFTWKENGSYRFYK